MTGKNVWVTSFAAGVMGIVLLLAGTPSVTANEKPSAATGEIKIDNFSFGPQTVTVPVGATVIWTNRDVIPQMGEVQRACSTLRCGTRTKSSPTHFELFLIFFLVADPRVLPGH